MSFTILSELLNIQKTDLFEMKESVLYRMTSLEWFLIYLLENKMSSSNEYDYPKIQSDEFYSSGISFTRNIRFFRDDAYFGKEHHDVIMVFDRDKLSKKYKIEPFHDENVENDTIDIDDRHKRAIAKSKLKQSEEIVTAKQISNLTSYITKVYVDVPSDTKRAYSSSAFNHMLDLLFISYIRANYDKEYFLDNFSVYQRNYGKVENKILQRLQPLIEQFLHTIPNKDYLDPKHYYNKSHINEKWYNFIQEFIKSKCNVEFVQSIHPIIASEKPYKM
jgi:hypothetical protein